MGAEVAQPASFSAQLGFGPLRAFRLVSYAPSLCVVQLAPLGEGTAQVVNVEFLVHLRGARPPPWPPWPLASPRLPGLGGAVRTANVKHQLITV